MDSFKSIQSATTSELIKVKGSKFIGLAFPVKDENQIKDRLEEVKQTYKSASHYCYAWQIGTNDKLVRTNDDGEPHNSAGKPILGQIFSKEITNVLVIVIRYYGGTKLGVGGLISAYKESAQLALDKAKIMKQTINKEIGLHYKYKDLNTIMRFTKQLNLEIIDQDLNLECTTTISVRESLYQEVILKFQALKDVTAKVL